MSNPAIVIAALGLGGVFVSTLGAILVELIRARKKTEDVKQEVISAKGSADEQLVTLVNSVADIKERLDQHIQWHFEHNPFVYIGRRDNR